MLALLSLMPIAVHKPQEALLAILFKMDPLRLLKLLLSFQA